MLFQVQARTQVVVLRSNVVSGSSDSISGLKFELNLSFRFNFGFNSSSFSRSTYSLGSRYDFESGFGSDCGSNTAVSEFNLCSGIAGSGSDTVPSRSALNMCGSS